MIISSKIENKIKELPEDDSFKALMLELLQYAPYTEAQMRYKKHYQDEVDKYIEAHKESVQK